MGASPMESTGEAPVPRELSMCLCGCGGGSWGSCRRRRGGLAGLIPVASEPIGEHGDGFFVEHFLGTEGGHFVFLAVEAFVAGVVEEVDQPLARGVAGQVGRISFVALLAAETVAVEAANR